MVGPNDLTFDDFFKLLILYIEKMILISNLSIMNTQKLGLKVPPKTNAKENYDERILWCQWSFRENARNYKQICAFGSYFSSFERGNGGAALQCYFILGLNQTYSHMVFCSKVFLKLLLAVYRIDTFVILGAL